MSNYSPEMVILSWVNSVMRVYLISRESSLTYLVECQQQCLLFMAGGAVFRVGGGGVKFSKPREIGGVFFFFNTVELKAVDF